jgi:hypothetical protein
MPIPCTNRLTVVGRKVDIKTFDRNRSWPSKFGTRFREPLVVSATRHTWQFETDLPPLEPLKRLSARYPLLAFLLDYDQEPKRHKGLAKARGGRLESHEFRY